MDEKTVPAATKTVFEIYVVHKEICDIQTQLQYGISFIKVTHF